MNSKKLYRAKDNAMLAGVCGGLGEFFGIDPTLIRLGWCAFSLFAGAGIWAYIIAALIIPSRPTYIEGEKV